MTREGLIEVMARALCVDDGVDPDVVGYDRTGSDFPNWYVVQGTAEAVLSAIEAAGVRLVYPGEAPAQLIDGDERTTVRIFTPYAPTSPGAITGVRRAEMPCSPPPPYAPQKDESND